MARTYAAPELARLLATSHVTHWKVQVENPDGVMQEMTSFLGVDWVARLAWNDDDGKAVDEATVALYRWDAATDVSLSPEMGGSPANRNAAAAYAKFIELNRRVTFQVAVVARDVVPAAGDFRPVFDGRIAHVGGEGTDYVVLSCGGRGAELQRTQIDEKTRYGSPAGTPLRTALQAVVDQWAEAPPVIYEPAVVGRNVKEWDQEPGNLLDALRAVAGQGGQAIRYRWDAADVYRLTLWTPDRNGTAGAPAFWISPDDYVEKDAPAKDIASVRSKAIVRFFNPLTNKVETQTFEDAVSRGKYGRQSVEIRRDETSTISTAAEALALATIVVNDLAEPPADHTLKIPLFYLVEVGDVVGLRADGVFYDADQVMSVAGFAHEVNEEGEGWTTLTFRSRVVGAWREWIRKGGGGIGGRQGAEIGEVTIVETVTRPNIGGVPSGLVELTAVDPTSALTAVEFRTRLGDAGAWTAWAADAAPYAASVALVPDESSAVEYRVSGYRADGTVGVIRQAVVEFPYALKGFLEVRARVTAASATQVSVTVDAIAPSGAPGTPQVTLVALTGSATIASGPAVGVASPSGTVWTFNRGAALGADGFAQFRATLTGYQSDDDQVTIAAQGRDTVPLAIKATPLAVTATQLQVAVTVTDPLGTGPSTVTITHLGVGAVTLDGGASLASGATASFTNNVARTLAVTRPAFGTGVGRVSLTAALAGRVSDSDSVDVAPQDRDTRLPRGSARVVENGATAQLFVRVSDPDAMLSSIEYAAALGNAALGAFAAMTWDAAAGEWKSPAIALIEKQATRIEYRLWATPPGGALQVVDGGSVRTAIGSKPLPPEVRHVIGGDGTLQIVARGDSDTLSQRVLVKVESEPTAADVIANGALYDGRTAAHQHDTKLRPGDQVYYAVLSFNAAAGGGVASDIVTRPVVWLGAGGATIKVGRVVVTDTFVTFDQIEYGPETSHADVYVVEHRTDPGAPTSVVRQGYTPPGSPLRPGVTSLSVPLSQADAYVVASFAAISVLNAPGVGEAIAAGVFSGTVTLKAQGTGAAVTRPAPPTALALPAPDAVTQTAYLDVTMPANVVGPPAVDFLRVFRDGQPAFDVARTAAAGAVQRINDPGRTPLATYTYQVYSLTAAGVLSATGSPVASVTMPAQKVPTPTLADDGYYPYAGGTPLTATQPDGNYAGITFALFHRNVVAGGADPGSGYTEAETSTSRSWTHYHAMSSIAKREWVYVVARRQGWTDSDPSLHRAIDIPAASAGA